ncbi:MAG: flagellar assembly protein FliW [Lachnospiraceae bacterium]|nr:flagellar assembly protein FliW [Lachnospiraceae bacterium]MCR5476111.1 flagellar assembly protein FliW [Lachnospiraceae bacterium]
MLVKTKVFGEVEVADEKILTFDNGIIGFPDLKHFALMHDEEKGADAGIRYLQSIEEPGFAMPVMDPLIVVPNYDPQVNDEYLSGLGELTEENIVVLVTVTVPSDLTKMTVNLQGPIVINSDNKKAAQIIVEGNDFSVKFPIYDILKARKDGE